VSALSAIENVEDVNDAGLTVLPVADPYRFAVTRKAGRMVMQGNVPTRDVQAALTSSGVEGGDGVTLASGAPDRWEAAIGAAVAALSQLQDGTVSAEGTAVRLSGLAETSEAREAVLAALVLPEGFTLAADIQAKDDGAFEVTLRFDAAKGAEITGQVPEDLSIDALRDALGVADVTGDVKAARGGDGGPILAQFSLLKAVLAEAERLDLVVSSEGARATGVVTPGKSAALLQGKLQQVFGDEAEITLAALTPLPQDGATRTHAATGIKERFSGGFWLPDVPFSSSLEACAQRTRDMLAAAPISFVSGGAQMDAAGQRALAALAPIIRRCVSEARLTAQIAGHTDDRGRNNYQLSAERAVVVRQMLVSQGVAPAALSAVGSGASKPIADNSTEAGRAANRRITVAWGYQG